MIDIILWLLFFAILIIAAYYVLGLIKAPEPIKQIVSLILAIVFIYMLLSKLGVFNL